MNWSAYEKPQTLSEALTLLEKAGGKGRLIAGGTDLVLQLKRGGCRADRLVDITGILELKKIEALDGWIRIGAAVTHAQAAKHPLLRQEAAALAEGCSQVGSPQIRQVGTLVGNIVSAQPAADAAIPLLALEAELKVLSVGAERWLPLEEAYQGIGLSTVDPTKEAVTEIRFRKMEENGATGFFRMARRKALTLPMLNGALALRFDPSLNRVEKARIAIGPVADRPYRARGAEAYLESVAISKEAIAEAARIASAEANPRSSLIRGGATYRKEMVRLYLTREIQSLVDETKKREQGR
ncbi:MAG: FAD binding domain-containing protein [Deltaproteobacteria bacterium]|nr:FAD binding domain-containing protein [Deltaproteobacteria bacterium]